MLGQRYTTPMVTVVCPVTNLHHMASLQSASSCNCTSYAGRVGVDYKSPITITITITVPIKLSITITITITVPIKLSITITITISGD